MVTVIIAVEVTECHVHVRFWNVTANTILEHSYVSSGDMRCFSPIM